VDWSYELLTEPEQVLLQRASVFRNGMKLEAVEAVSGLGDQHTTDTTELLVSRVEENPIVTECSGSSGRD